MTPFARSPIHARPPRRRRRHGIFLTDAMIGFAITAVLALALVTAITKARRAETRLDEGAAAMRIARRAMADLRQGKPLAKITDDAETEIKVTPLDGGAKPANQTWASVSVTYHGRSASLVGLVPAKGVAR